MLSDAIHNLLNRKISSDQELDLLKKDYDSWCVQVVQKMQANTAYFSKADQLHFERLGRVPGEGWGIAFSSRHSHILNMLSLKFDRLRDIINWVQLRPR